MKRKNSIIHQGGSDYVDPMELVALEQELADLKRQQGIPEKRSWWIRLGDWITQHFGGPKRVERKTYIRLAIACGWFCGAHRYYAGQKLLGTLYLLFCWTGIPFAMTLVDLMIALPMKADEKGCIEL